MDDYDHPNHPQTKDSIYSSRDFAGSIIGAVITGGLILLVWYYLGKQKDFTGTYGTGIFLVSPMLCGFIAGAISNWNKARPTATTWLSSLVQFLVSCFALLVFGIEGVVCIVMASPLIYPMFALGTFLGQIAMNLKRGSRRLFVSALPVIVGMGVAANAMDPYAATKTESTTYIVNATPDKIWPLLFDLHDLPEPDQWIFRTGIAFTIGTHASGQVVGASRECILSTGTMNETITALDVNRYMRFDVHNTPPSIKESNPFHDIHPRHETGSFKVHWGEFKLEPLPGGRTKFTGTSTYSYNIFPAWYWGLITDTVAEQIHVRMMGEIKRRVEPK
jgi:hypothetical protein